MFVFRITYSYCGDISSYSQLAENEEDAKKRFYEKYKSGAKICRIVRS